ncbi:MAG: hypothetical protein JOZ96_18370 [Acidobacteria bacterium]|nr:hypothetical protein [Acidobacteriota bacterium]
MKNTINLDKVVRKLGVEAATPVAGEQVVVTVDRGTGEAVRKTLGVRFGGNYTDYLVTNDRNPAASGSGKLSPYYVRDAQKERTLALDIGVAACSCPEGSEAKAAESLHWGGSPAQTFAALMERWVLEFIPPGDEGRFIDTYDAARAPLESHLARRALAQTGLVLLPRVSLSGEAAVPREIVVGPVEVGVRLQDYKEQQSLTVEAGLRLDEQDYVRAYVFQERQESPEELFKRHLREYFEQRVTFEQFSRELQYPHLKQPMLQALGAALLQVGRRVSFINFSPGGGKTTKPPREFVAVTYPYNHNIPGRAQPVVIHNTVQLYCDNSVAFLASGVDDLEAWVKGTLNVILKRHLIGKTYADLLLRFAPLENVKSELVESIKRELSARAAGVGYKVDHLVSVPHLKELDLVNPFDLSFDDTFETKLDKFEVQLKFDLRLRIPNLQTVKTYLNRDEDVKEEIKAAVLSETRRLLRTIHPERFYLHFNHPDDEAKDPSERQAVKWLIDEEIRKGLTLKFGAEPLGLTTRVGRTDLTDRYNELCFVIRELHVSIEPHDPQGTESLTLTGNFEVRGVYPDSNGWQRFSSMRLDLDGLQTQLQNHLKSELKTYYQSGFMFQNQIARRQVFKVVESYATQYMRREFGLMVHLTNLDRNTTEAERSHRGLLGDIEKRKLNDAREQGEDLMNKIKALKKRRSLLLLSPDDKEEVEELNNSIRILEEELDSITSPRFGRHHLAAALESQLPDDLPREGEANHVSVQYELDAEAKPQLTE